jgi:hypothetical protein
MLPKSIYAYGYVALRNLNANPVLVKPDQMEFLFFPNRSAFNYVIAIEVADGLILLDATEPFSSPNILPLRVLNWED